MRLPDDMSRAAASPELAVKPAGRGVLIMSGKPVEYAMKPEHRREFIERVFSIPKLSRLELAIDEGHARLRFERGAGAPPELLRSLARAMRAEKPDQSALADLGLIEVLSPDRRMEISRAGSRLTFLRVKALRPERYRFFHPEFRDPAARNAILADLMGVAYLNQRIGSGWNGGYIEVEFQVGRMTIESLLEIIESALLGTIASASRHHAQPFHFRRHLVDTNLALAVLSDYLFAPARVVSMVTLWMLNARHVRPTIRSLQEWRVNLDVLYSTIAFLTLLSMSFIASALMYWMFEFWPRRVKRLREAEMTKFLSRLKRCPRSVWVDRDGTEMEVQLSHLRLGDTVILREGDIAPGDGRALSGDAMVAESWTAGLHRKETGDVIHCSGRIASGEARMRLDSLGMGAATSTLAEWHTQAMLAPVSQERVRRLATSTVLPALALAAVAIFRGGVSMAKGMVRPDYVTGPLISRELGWVASVMEAAQNGILINNDGALEKLAQCDCLVFSPTVKWRQGERPAEEIGKALRELGVEEILMATGSTGGSRALAMLQKGIGVSCPVDAGGLIKERQYLGRRVAFIGDCVALKEAAAQADVAVHVSHPPFREIPPGPIALFEPEPEGVLALRRIATAYNNRLRASFATALIPNAACVVGAFYFGLPILGVVALTNAGTLASYLHAGRALRAAQAGRDSLVAT
jgi:cation transport ATPase